MIVFDVVAKLRMSHTFATPAFLDGVMSLRTDETLDKFDCMTFA